MHDPNAALIRDRAVAILADAPAVTMPLPELAHRLGTIDPDGLARVLATDPRLALLGPPVFGFSLADRAADYEQALADAGIRTARRVALLHPTPAPASGVAGLLRETTARLLAPGPNGGRADHLAELAERTHRAVLATGSVGAAPSTTPPPGPRPSPRAPRPEPRRGPRPPRDP